NGDRINSNIDFFGSIKNLDVSLSGSQKLQLTGSGDIMDIHIDRDATIHADKYAVKTANWSGDRNDKSSLHVTESFVAADPDNTGVKLLGNPTKIKQ
ncbi:MAG: hypothetical protein WBO36_09125, partial [Saprospiraceae bacterium]